MNKLSFISIILLSCSFSLFAQENTGENPLYNAVISADADAVKKALASGADINKQSDNGYTALMWACSWGSRLPYAEMAKLLIAENADVNIIAKDGTTAILEAAQVSNEITRLLIDKGADIKARRNDGKGIFTSCIFGILMDAVDLELAEFILSNGADVNEAATSGDIEGWTPLHYTVSNGKIELVNFLIKKGANVNATTVQGLTPLSLALSREYPEIAKMLKAAGAK